MLIRPPYHVEQLDHQTRWEATRRHPVYIQLFETYTAARQDGCEDRWERIRRHPDYLGACNCVQIFGPPIDPRIEYSEIDPETIAGFTRSAFSRPTVKSLTGVLADSVPASALRKIGIAFQKCAQVQGGDASEEDAVAALAALTDILHSDDADLNRMLDAPFYSVSPAAPRDMWEAEMVSIQTEWKERLSLPTRRNHPAKYASYFQAWDLREGWSSGTYKRQQALPLKEVAKTLGVSSSKAGSHYSRAFELIFGYEYTPRDWVEVMGIQQLSQFFVGIPASALLRRVGRAPQRNARQTPETSGQDANPHCDGEAESTDLSGRELVDRVVQLFDSGEDDQQILATLGLCPSDEVLEGLQVLRDRFAQTTGPQASK